MSIKPRKTRQSEEHIPPVDTSELSAPEPTKKEEPKPVGDIVKVKVLIGTLSWKGTHFQKGETFTCTKEDLAQFDPKDVEIIS